MPLEPHSKLGQYEVLSTLGAGGMGEVYRARDTKLGREVALKLLLEEVSGDAERLARFEREARVLASLNHPNIATLHGFESDGDTSFLVMELVEGETLSDRIQSGALPVSGAVPLFLQIAEGLAAAHEQGVIHRDLKPANIKLAGDGSRQMAKILDFGLARAMAPDPGPGADPRASASPTLTLAATLRGEIMGTAAYMSPEQASGKPVDRRTDIWAFGACLYEALTGRRAFPGEDAVNTLAAVIRDDVDLDALPPDCPSSLRHLLSRCLERDRHERIQDIGDARWELAHPRAETPAEPVARLRAVPVLAATLAVAIALVAFFASRGSEGSATRLRPLAKLEISIPPHIPVVNPNGSSATPPFALSRDGRRIVIAGGNVRGFFLRELDGLDYESFGETAVSSAWWPVFTADGRSVLFSEGALRRIDIESQEAVTLSGGMHESTAGTASKGSTANGDVYYSALEGLFVISPTSHEPKLLLPVEEGRRLAISFVAPDGDLLLLEQYEPGSPTAQIAAFTPATGAVETLMVGNRAVYAASGHLVFRRGSSLAAVRFDLAARESSGEAIELDSLFPGVDFAQSPWHLAEDGSLVHLDIGKGAVRLVQFDRDGNREVLGFPAGDYRHIRFGPGDDRLWLSVWRNGLDVMSCELSRSSCLPVSVESAAEQFPVASPDGRTVYLSSNRDGALEIYSRPADGTGAPARLTTLGESIWASDISADGKTLILWRWSAEGSDVLALDVESKELEPLLAEGRNEWWARLSPDGRWLAYGADADGTQQIYVRPYPDVQSARFKITVDGGIQPRWARSERGLEIYYQRQDEILAVELHEDNGELRAGTPVRLAQGAELGVYAAGELAVSSDGSRFVILEAEGEVRPPRFVVVQNFFDELERLVPTD